MLLTGVLPLLIGVGCPSASPPPDQPPEQQTPDQPLDPGINLAPTLGALAVSASVEVGSAVTATAELMDAEDQVKLRIDWGDGTSAESALGASRTEALQHTYAAPGTFTVTFTAIDAIGQTSTVQSAQTTITAMATSPAVNQPPTLGAVSATPVAVVGGSVTASAELTDTENQVRLRVDWGDGTGEDSTTGASRTQSLTHAYAATGSFTVAFTAIDAAAQSSATKTAATTINANNGITVATGPGRADPEGVAPAAASTALITWKDARGADRTMTLGAYLYQYDFTFDDGQQIVSRNANDDAYGHPGFGFVVSHNNQNGNSPIGKANPPTNVQTTVFTGGHHAVHRVELMYDRDKEGGGYGIRIPVVIEWFVATGRDHPVWSVTWLTGSAINPVPTNFDVYRMDVRGPYGSLNFDGAATRAAGDAVGGVAWGDFGLSFTTNDAQLTLNSPWTYDTPNRVNFTAMWTAAVNAEMGIVQTRPLDKEMGYPDRVYGRERGSTSGGAYLNKGNCNSWGDNRVYGMPCVGGWPYQLMNFDWDPTTGKPANEATGTKLIAWGSPYGWLGASSFDLFDFSATADGRGDRAYATFVVLGPRCRYSGGVCDQEGDVPLTIRAVEALSAATISNVTTGAVVTQVPSGPGASQMKSITNGYNDTYAAYYLSAATNQVTFTFTPAGGQPVRTPIFVVQNYTAAQMPRVVVGGVELGVNIGAGSGAFASINTAANELWITLNQTVSTATNVQIGP